jgi:hypothetical protein
MEKGQAESRPGLLSQMAHNKLLGTGGYFAELFFCGGGITSLCCAQAPSPNAVTRKATTIILFNSFNSISPPFVAGCSGPV